jgi:prepilin-type N-terminal cleavage/methylation domain-containing protein
MNGQQGMTMVELIVAVAVTGIIVVFFGTAVYQIMTVSGYGNSRLIAAHELENAAYWLNRDGQQATIASGGSSLALTLSDNSSVTYSLSGTELRRSAGGDSIILARNITNLDFSVGSRVITMSLTSSPEGRYDVSANGTYRVYLRPSEAG